jgi:hypothetical protein
MKTPERYKQITFVDQSTPNFNTEQRGLVVQKIKGDYACCLHAY